MTHPQEPSAERVEAGAKACCHQFGVVKWDALDEGYRAGYRRGARAVLMAADAAAPQAAQAQAEAVPVAVIGRDWQFLWASGDAIVDIVKRHGLKIGTKLYTHPAPQAQEQAMREIECPPDPDVVDRAILREAGAAERKPLTNEQHRRICEIYFSTFSPHLHDLFREYGQRIEVAHGIGSITAASEGEGNG